MIVRVPTNETPATVVAEPPLRWSRKLRVEALSVTVSLYRPALSFVTGTPPELKVSFPTAFTRPRSVPRSEPPVFETVPPAPPVDPEPPEEPPDEPPEEPPEEPPPAPEVLNTPYMKSGWSSHTNRYWLPGWKVTVQVGVPVPPIVVETSTPGPPRWKLCVKASSTAWIVYVPGGIVGGVVAWLPTFVPSSKVRPIEAS